MRRDSVIYIGRIIGGSDGVVVGIKEQDETEYGTSVTSTCSIDATRGLTDTITYSQLT